MVEADEVTSSYTKGAKVGEEISVFCSGIGIRQFTCQSGNRWQPLDVADACFGKNFDN